MKSLNLLLSVLFGALLTTGSISNGASKFPQCKDGRSTSSFANVKTMFQNVLGINASNRSLIRQSHDGDPAQYWLNNDHGFASLRMKASIDASARAAACQVDSKTLRLTGCASFIGIKKCMVTEIKKTDPDVFRISFAGHPNWNENYVTSGLSATSR